MNAINSPESGRPVPADWHPRRCARRAEEARPQPRRPVGGERVSPDGRGESAEAALAGYRASARGCDRRGTAGNLAQPVRQRGQSAAAREDVMAPASSAARRPREAGNAPMPSPTAPRLSESATPDGDGCTIVLALTQARHFAIASFFPAIADILIGGERVRQERSSTVTSSTVCGSEWFSKWPQARRGR